MLQEHEEESRTLGYSKDHQPYVVIVGGGQVRWTLILSSINIPYQEILLYLYNIWSSINIPYEHIPFFEHFIIQPYIYIHPLNHQNGIALAARLMRLHVSCLVLEKNERPGDKQRKWQPSLPSLLATPHIPHPICALILTLIYLQSFFSLTFYACPYSLFMHMPYIVSLRWQLEEEISHAMPARPDTNQSPPVSGLSRPLPHLPTQGYVWRLVGDVHQGTPILYSNPLIYCSFPLFWFSAPILYLIHCSFPLL